MTFRTPISTQQYTPKINHASKILSLGSCFAVEMYNKMSNLKFEITANPHGILFNPLSIAISLEQLINGKVFRKVDLELDNEYFFSWHHHGSFSGYNSNEVLRNINDRIAIGRKALQKADWLMITFGTAFVYHLLESGGAVGNCHKQEQSLFDRKLVSSDTIYNMYKNTIQLIRKINPTISILFSVSPVRHLSDGLIENSRSKAILNNAVHKLVDEMLNVHYFPSYEIIMDDLRDYRFYKRDKIHPSEEAVDYIWNVFQYSFFENKTIDLNKKIDSINKSLSHRPRQIDSESHKKFKETLLKKMRKLQSFEEINFNDEIENLGIINR